MLQGISRGVHLHLDGPKREIGSQLHIESPLSSLTPIRKEAFYEKDLILADRDMVETASDEILRDADKEDVALLVVGDPFGCVVIEDLVSS